jgi:hypothetical protein
MTDQPKPRKPRTKTGRGANVTVYFGNKEDRYREWAVRHRETVKALIMAHVDIINRTEIDIFDEVSAPRN